MRLEELKDVASEYERLRKLLKGIDRNLSGAPTEKVDEYYNLRLKMVAMKQRAFQIQSACLSSYNKESACPKCHFGFRTTKFQECYLRDPFNPIMNFTSNEGYRNSPPCGIGELMVRGCPNCGAETFEKPLDRS